MINEQLLREPTLAKLQTKLLAAQMCHPNAVQSLIDEALDALDEFARAALAQPAECGEVVPKWWMRETEEGFEWTDTAPLVLRGWTPLYTTPPASQEQAQQSASLFDIAADRAEVAKVLRRVSRALDVSTDDRTIVCHAASMIELDGAQQPKPQPMTDEQRQTAWQAAEDLMTAHPNRSWRDCLCDAIEAHHGITAQAKKETP